MYEGADLINWPRALYYFKKLIKVTNCSSVFNWRINGYKDFWGIIKKTKTEAPFKQISMNKHAILDIELWIYTQRRTHHVPDKEHYMVWTNQLLDSYDLILPLKVRSHRDLILIPKIIVRINFRYTHLTWVVNLDVANNQTVVQHINTTSSRWPRVRNCVRVYIYIYI